MAQKVLMLNGRLKIRPVVSTESLQNIADQCFGLVLNPDIAPVEAASFDDRNFIVYGYLKTRGAETDSTYQRFDKFVIKLYNASETPQYNWYNTVNSNLLTISTQCEPSLKVPYPIFAIGRENEKGPEHTVTIFDVPLLDAALFENCSCEQLIRDGSLLKVAGQLTAKHIIRLTVFVPGKTLAHGESMNEELAFSWGESLARLTLVMQELLLPDVNARERWVVNVLAASDMLYDPYIKSVSNDSQRAVLTQVLDRFRAETLPKLQTLKHIQWVHGDIADHNVLKAVDGGNEGVIEGAANVVTGVIDFDDAVISHRILDLSFALLDILSTENHEVSLRHAKQLYKGYSSLLKLSEPETYVLFDVILVLFVRNIALVNFQEKQIDPENSYLTALQNNVWDSFQYVLNMGREHLMKEIEIV